MANDYEVLGLKEGADEKEVKRAYFKLVRQFSPEKDPERFQQIREAYENLKKGNGKKTLTLKIPDDPFAGKMFQQIETRYKQHDYWGAMNTAEEAIKYYGEFEGFLYYLALSQRKNFYTGKSVKSFEKLVEQNPKNAEFAKELAISYLERGYGKKADTAFEKAYHMGCREIEFLDSYAKNCNERGNKKRALELLLEMIAAASVDRKEYILDLLDAYTGVFMLCVDTGGERQEEIQTSFLEFMGEAVPYMAEYPEELEGMIGAVMYGLKSLGRLEAELEREIRDCLKRGIGREKSDALWKDVEQRIDNVLVEKDPRLSEVMKAAYEGFVLDGYAEEEYGEQIRRFVLLDCKLCILEEWPGIKAEFDIIKENYPGFYDAIREYEDTLEHTNNLDYLREKMKKDHDRLGRYISGGMYDEKYSRNSSQPEMIAEGGYGTDPYVRMQPKVGRNDPCPCGSGKKYKKCCGKGA